VTGARPGWNAHTSSMSVKPLQPKLTSPPPPRSSSSEVAAAAAELTGPAEQATQEPVVGSYATGVQVGLARRRRISHLDGWGLFTASGNAAQPASRSALSADDHRGSLQSE
jgi:hypothetical protein